MVMAMKFEGSAALPPSWEDRTTSADTVVEGDYHSLKLAQQMKILQVCVAGCRYQMYAALPVR